MIKTTSKANLRAQVGSYFKPPDCHLVPTVKPYSHLKGGSEEFLPCAKAEPVQHCSLRIPQCQGDTEVFLRKSTNASSIYRQVPLTLPPKVSGAPAGTRTQNPRLFQSFDESIFKFEIFCEVDIFCLTILSWLQSQSK